jgi:tRNA/tmRNA/rRNA uracil-C5-methylase (TrmA/RlmC/RlmD family)
VPIRTGAPARFRHRARLAVRGRASSPKVGIFREGTHRIVDIPRCVIHHPLVNRVADELKRAMVDLRSPPYSDEAHAGLVRYLQVVVDRGSQTAQVVLVANDDDVDASRPLLSALQERLGPALHSLFWNGNSARSNTILGPLWERIAGPESTVETIGGARVFYPPGAFGQSHLDLADEIVGIVHGWVPAGASVAEFYAGTGPLGLGLAARGSRVTFNEVAGDSLRGLALGIAALDDAARARTRVEAGTAGSLAHLAAAADVVLVDPPRKGLDAPLLDALRTAPPPRLVYVACGFEAFCRDAEALTSSGRLRLRDIVACDLFPYTEHVEVVARFDRSEGGEPTPTTPHL